MSYNMTWDEWCKKNNCIWNGSNYAKILVEGIELDIYNTGYMDFDTSFKARKLITQINEHFDINVIQDSTMYFFDSYEELDKFIEEERLYIKKIKQLTKEANLIKDF